MATMTRTMPPDAPMMMGWSKGIAFQSSLPRRFIFPPSLTWDSCGTSRRRISFRRPGCGRTGRARLSEIAGALLRHEGEIPAEVVFDAIEAELERRGIDP